jgi:hypothetical protein
MGDRVKILVPDQGGNMTEAIGQNMEIVEAKEPWSEYILEDGTKIRAKQPVVCIVKLDQKASNGTDVYVMQGQTIMHVIPTKI